MRFIKLTDKCHVLAESIAEVRVDGDWVQVRTAHGSQIAVPRDYGQSADATRDRLLAEVVAATRVEAVEGVLLEAEAPRRPARAAKAAGA